MNRNIQIRVRLNQVEYAALDNAPGDSTTEKIRALIHSEGIVSRIVGDLGKAQKSALDEINSRFDRLESNGAGGSKKLTDAGAGDAKNPAVADMADSEKNLRRFILELIKSLFNVPPEGEQKAAIVAGARAIQNGDFALDHLAKILIWIRDARITGMAWGDLARAAERMEKGE